MSCLGKKDLCEIIEIISEYFYKYRIGNHGNYNTFSIIEVNNKNLIKVEYGYRGIECIFTICIYDDNAVSIYYDDIRVFDKIVDDIKNKDKEIVKDFSHKILHELFHKYLSEKTEIVIKSLSN